MIFRIREAREAAGISQSQLAERLGINATTLSGYETGRHDPKSDTLILIAEICHTSIDFLLNRTTVKTKTLSLEAQRIGHKFDSFSEDKKRLLRGFIVLLEEADKAASLEAMLDAADEAEDQEA